MLQTIHHFLLRKLLAFKLKRAGAREIKMSNLVGEKSNGSCLFKLSFFSKMSSYSCIATRKNIFFRPYEHDINIFDYKDRSIYINIQEEKPIIELISARKGEKSIKILQLLGIKNNYTFDYKSISKLFNIDNHIKFSKFLAISCKTKEVLVFNFSAKKEGVYKLYSIVVKQYSNKIVFILKEYDYNQEDSMLFKKVYHLKDETFYLEKGIFELLKKEPYILEHLFKKEFIETIHMLPDNIDANSLKDFHALIDMLLV